MNTPATPSTARPSIWRPSPRSYGQRSHTAAEVRRVGSTTSSWGLARHERLPRTRARPPRSVSDGERPSSVGSMSFSRCSSSERASCWCAACRGEEVRSDGHPAGDTFRPMTSGEELRDIATLAQNPLLAGLSLDEVGSLLSRLEVIPVTAGSVASNERGLCFVLSGELELRDSSAEPRRLVAGDVFGELSLWDARAGATILARSELRLARLRPPRTRSSRRRPQRRRCTSRTGY
jgi:hypothetical protein